MQPLSQWKSTTYSGFEPVALGIQHVMRMRRIIFSFVARLALPYFSTLRQKRRHIRKKKQVIEHKKMCVLIFSTTCLYFKKNSARYYHRCTYNNIY
jgi:hypothetical protein